MTRLQQAWDKQAHSVNVHTANFPLIPLLVDMQLDKRVSMGHLAPTHFHFTAAFITGAPPAHFDQSLPSEAPHSSSTQGVTSLSPTPPSPLFPGCHTGSNPNGSCPPRLPAGPLDMFRLRSATSCDSKLQVVGVEKPTLGRAKINFCMCILKC